ncbi:MAG TPA: NAD(P)-dependent oxidoreductase [Solirubrobacteraceae bacterium]|nr:NAD(P)-dependent oxidoreductase [Solirubrobacteraceae bacterium]
MIAWLTDEQPEARREALGPLPDGWEARDWPDDPAAAPDRERVRFVVPSSRRSRGLDILPALEVVQVRSAGVDWVLPLVPPGVTLCDAGGARDVPMAEWVVAAILADAKRARAVGEGQGAREWRPMRMGDVAGLRVLVLGHGGIGRAAARMLTALGCEVTGVARRARDGVHGIDELPRLLGRADVLVDLLPLTEATRGLVDAAVLAALPGGALVVNAGRGATLDTGALLAELRARRLRAVLDVVEPEPLPAGHPLWTAPGAIVSPHVAGDTPAAERAAWALAGEQLRRFAAGEPLRNVVGEAGY